ncbi:sigma factor-like helix-turn-helix DNA-binding protein [Bacillus sp. CH30_1T]|uniref:sigma factor-like helix-turn-helix DNA-binding protein n=1 Tax=Bacillus sp. CH30_1T TaxID=2604836 RepID=UPI00165E40D4|nr:sigma factor-like helix-turn-helix DNA-binding protein [Bacillus sp. CH30_1T]
MQTRSGLKKNEGQPNDEVMEELVPKLYRYCYFLTKSKWDGEDLAQESICKALSHYPAVQNWSSSLLNKIAYHLWVDKVRKQSKESIGGVPEVKAEDISKEGISLETVEKLSRKMTPKQLVTFVLKEAFQFKIFEVADVLGMTETAVKALLNRSREKLKKFSEDGDGSGVQTYWNETLQEELNAILYRSLMAQDPSLLLAYIPILLAHAPAQGRIVRTSDSPSSILSLAA